MCFTDPFVNFLSAVWNPTSGDQLPTTALRHVRSFESVGNAGEKYNLSINCSCSITMLVDIRYTVGIYIYIQYKYKCTLV